MSLASWSASVASWKAKVSGRRTANGQWDDDAVFEPLAQNYCRDVVKKLGSLVCWSVMVAKWGNSGAMRGPRQATQLLTGSFKIENGRIQMQR
jgi:hypothetical protein